MFKNSKKNSTHIKYYVIYLYDKNKVQSLLKLIIKNWSIFYPNNFKISSSLSFLNFPNNFIFTLGSITQFST